MTSDIEKIEDLRRIATGYRREASLWPRSERGQQVARMLICYAADLEFLALDWEQQKARADRPDGTWTRHD